MTKRERRNATRINRHTDYTRAAMAKSESELFALLKKLEEQKPEEQKPEGQKPEGPPFLLILDTVQDPHNLGACLRTADAAGVHAVIAPKDRSVGLTDAVRRVACGGAENVPFVQVTNLARTLRELKEAGVWLVGTADDAESTIHEIDLCGPLAIVMGAEEKGMRRLTSELCDFTARIPMSGSVECLNVSVAAGVCLFEAVRQRLGQTKEAPNKE